MDDAKARIISDLALDASKEAVELLRRKSELGFDLAMKAKIFSAASAILEARLRVMREIVGGEQLTELVDATADGIKKSMAEHGFGDVVDAMRAAAARVGL